MFGVILFSLLFAAVFFAVDLEPAIAAKRATRRTAEARRINRALRGARREACRARVAAAWRYADNGQPIGTK